jgi:hypothetical protein
VPLVPGTAGWAAGAIGDQVRPPSAVWNDRGADSLASLIEVTQATRGLAAPTKDRSAPAAPAAASPAAETSVHDRPAFDVTSTVVPLAPGLMTHQVVGLAMATAGKALGAGEAGEAGEVKQAAGPGVAGAALLMRTVETGAQLLPPSEVEEKSSVATPAALLATYSTGRMPVVGEKNVGSP